MAQLTVNWPDDVPAVVTAPDGSTWPISDLSEKAVHYGFLNGFRQGSGDASAGTAKEMRSKGFSDEEIKAKVTEERMEKFMRILNGELNARVGGPRGSRRDTIFSTVAEEFLTKAAAAKNMALPKKRDGKKPNQAYIDLLNAFSKKNEAAINAEVERRMAGPEDLAEALEL